MDRPKVFSRECLFKDVQLLDLCNLELSRTQHRSDIFWNVRHSSDPTPSDQLVIEQKSFVDWYELLDLLHVGLDERIEMLSELDQPSPLVQKIASWDTTLKMAVKTQLAGETWKLNSSQFDNQHMVPYFLKSAEEKETPFVVCRLYRSLFDVVIFECDQDDDQDEADKKLQDAYSLYARFRGEPRGQAPELPPGVKLTYFDSHSKTFTTGLSLQQVIARSEDLAGEMPTIVSVKLMHLNDFFGPSYSPLQATLAHQMPDDLKVAVARLLRGYQTARLETRNVFPEAHDSFGQRIEEVKSFKAIKHEQLVDQKVNESAKILKELSQAIRPKLDLAKRLPSFDRLGLRLLLDKYQLTTSPHVAKHVLLFDPAIAEPENAEEWKWHLGSFLDMKLKSNDHQFFFACPIDPIVGMQLPDLATVGQKAAIYKFVEDDQWCYVPTPALGSRPGVSSVDAQPVVIDENDYVNVDKSDYNMDNAAENTTNEPIETDEPKNLPSVQTSDPEPSVDLESQEHTMPKKSLEPIKDNAINILLLGETGVGKSTFINAYYNYLMFDSLDDALSAPELKGLITSTFVYTDSQFNCKSIKIAKNVDVTDADGVDAEKNEVFAPGQSMTQHAKAYTFQRGDQLIRIIDTPGIGDSRGVKVDQENFRQTIEYLKQLDHLNAICILLKPNVKRIELQTRYCIKELFSHLNRASINNVVFCFTNARSTGFRPGETLASLTEFVKKEIEEASNVQVPLETKNIISMDNEAFRYLVLTKNLSKEEEKYYDEEISERKTFARSWTISSKASEKLIKYAQDLPVLDIGEVVNYNQTRTLSGDLVEAILQVLAELAKELEHNKERNDSAKCKQIMDRITDILKRVASVTNYLSSRAVTIFNDHLDARLEEKFNDLKASRVQSDLSLGQTLSSARDLYRLYLSQMRQDTATKVQMNVDNEIAELTAILEQNPGSVNSAAQRAPQNSRFRNGI